MIDTGDLDVYLGLDVGKGEHPATALTPAGKKTFDKRLPNSEPKLFAKLQAKHGTVLVIVDQVASIGVLLLAIARELGCHVSYLPGLRMRWLADLYPGEAKTDAKDAFIIADATRAMPHTLRSVDLDDETIAELQMIVGFDDDLAAKRPACPTGCVACSHRSTHTWNGSWASACSTRPSCGCWTSSARRPRSARPDADGSSHCYGRQCSTSANSWPTRIEELLEAHPLCKAPMSMPGIGLRTGGRILIDVGDGTAFPSAAHLAAYAGLVPATRSSGSSIRGEQPSRRENKSSSAFFLPAFAALANPSSRPYYDKKIAQGKHHTQAILCLARGRADVLFAMLREGTFYQPPTPITP